MKKLSVILSVLLTMVIATQAFAVDRKVEDPALLGINAEIHTNTKTGMQATPILKDSVLYLTKGLSFTAANRVVTSNKKIVSVSKLKFTGKKVGSTILELDGMNYNTDVFTAKVSTKKTQKGYVGDTFDFTLYDTAGKDLRDLNIAWQSSNQNVAQVDDGKVQLVGKGSANIYAYLQGKKYTFKVSSKYKDGATIVYNAPIGNTVNLNSITGQKVTKIETDSTRVELLKNPKVKILTPGLSVLKVTTKNGSCTVNLYGESANRSSDSKITTAGNKKYLTLAVGETEYLNFPGLHQLPLWKSSNPKVAVVSEYGVIIPLKEGKSTISAKITGTTYKIYLTVKGETRPSEKETYRELHVLDNVNDQAGKSVWIDPNGNASLTDPSLKYYLVAFDTNGSDDVIETQNILEGNTAIRPTDPVRPQYIFSHWSNNGLLYNFTEPVMNHVTLLANWIHIKGYLFIDTNGDGINDTQLPVDDTGKVVGKLPTGVNGLPVTVIDYTDTDGNIKHINIATDTVPDDILDKKDDPIEGKTPAGGETDISYIKIDTDNDGITDTVIVVDSNTGKIIGDLPRDKEGNQITKITYVDPDGKVQTVDLTKDTVPDNIMGSDPIVVKPAESEKKYTVEFATNGGTAIPKQEINSGDKVTKPTDPEREEYLFKDWYWNGRVYDFNSPVLSNLIIVAEWQHIRGHLYIDTDGDGTVDTRVPVDDNGNVIGDFPKDKDGNEIKQVTVTDENGNKTVVNLDTGHITTDIISNSTNTNNPSKPSTQEEVEQYGVTHIVSFNTSGGTEVPDQHVLDGQTAERPEVPSRTLGTTEYTFCDWVLYGNSYNFETPVITDLGLRATWKQATGEVYIINSDGTKTRVPFAEDATINEDYFVVPDATGYVTPAQGETIDDYHFEGWFYIGSDGKTHRYYPKSDLLEEGTELVPKFVKNSYTVTFNPNGGTNLSQTSKTVHYGEAYGTLPTVTLSGQDFVGWFTEAQGGEHVLETTLMDKETDHTLYAHFSDKTYEITFDSAGGSAVEKQRVTYNEKIGNLPTPVKYGKTFDGWYFNDTKITSDTVYSYTNDIKLTAHWVAKKVLVVFDSQGGQITKTMKEIDNGDVVGELPIPVKEGYDFVGWYDDSVSGTKYTASTKVANETSLLLYAHYELKTYTVTFNDGGKTNTIIKQAEVPYNAVISEVVTVSTPGRANYTFEGWKLPDGTAYTNTTRMPAAPLIITATWSSNKFQVTFDPQEGTLANPSESTKEVQYGDAYGELPEVTRNHYKFDGWYTMPNGVVGTLITKDSIYNQTTATTAYAHWTANQHTLTLVPGKDMDEFSKNLKYDDTIGSLPTLGVAGYTFVGWFYSSSPTAVKVQSTDTMPDTDISIYARWTPNTYKVTLDANGGVFGTSPTTFKSVTYGEAFGALDTPQYEGYSFVKYIGPDNEEITATTVMEYVSPITVKAVWSKNQYTVTFKDELGDDYPTEPKTVTFGEPYGTLYTPEEVSGKTFIGWNTKADGLGLNISSTDTVSIAANHTLYSMFGTNVYTITFDSKGGTDVAPWVRSYNTPYGSLPTPTKQGYILEGWYDGETKVTEEDLVPSHAITLAAKWTPDTHTMYTVKHYKMTIDGTGYVLELADTKYGTTGDSVTPSTETYTGFTAPATQTVTINANGSTVVEYRYERNQHTFTLGTTDGCSTLGSTPSGTYYYGTQITLNATVSNGYDWSKWSDGTTSTSATFTMPDSAVNISPVVTAHEYTITYDLNGGLLTGAPETYTVTTNTFTLPTPTKTDMNFLGWTGSNGTTPQSEVIITKGSTGNLVYTANWKMKTAGYIVKHKLMNLDGSTYTVEDEQDYTVDVNTVVTPEVNNYTGFTAPETQTITIVQGDPIVVEYLYTRNQYTLTVSDTEGCDVDGVASGTYYYGKTLTLVATPQEGYDWNKWSNNTINPILTFTMPNSDLELTPVVTVHTYDITYELNGGTVTGQPTTYTIKTDSFTLPTPTKEDYNFLGWTGSNGETPQTIVTITKGTTGDLTYTANWKMKTVGYTVKHLLMNLDGSTYSLEEEHDYSANVKTVVTPETNTYTGFTAPDTQTITVTEGDPIVVEYRYTRNQHTFTLTPVTGCSVTGNESGTYYYGAELTLTATPDEGYDWSKWSDNTTTTTKTITMGDANLTLAPVVTAHEYTITYNLDGGSITDQPTTYTVSTNTFTLPTPTKSGLNFLGWTGSNGTTAQTAVTVTKGTTGDLTYTANWEVPTRTLTINTIYSGFWGNDNYSTINYTGVCEKVARKTYEIKPGDTVTILGNSCTDRTLYLTNDGSGKVINGSTNSTVGYDYSDAGTSKGVQFIMPDSDIEFKLDGYQQLHYAVDVYSGSLTFNPVTTGILKITNVYDNQWGETDSTINYGSISQTVAQKAYAIPVGIPVTIYGNNKTKRALQLQNNVSGSISYCGSKAVRYPVYGWYNDSSSNTTSGIKFNQPSNYLVLTLSGYSDGSGYIINIDAGSVTLTRPEDSTLTLGSMNTDAWGGDNFSTINYSGVSAKLDPTVAYSVPAGDTICILGNDCEARELHNGSGQNLGSSRGVKFTMPEEDTVLSLSSNSINTYNVDVDVGSISLEPLNSNILKLSNVDTDIWGTISVNGVLKDVEETACIVPQDEKVKVYGSNKTKRPLYLDNQASGETSYIGSKAVPYGNTGYYNDDSTKKTTGIEFKEPEGYLALQLNSSSDEYQVVVDDGSTKIKQPDVSELKIGGIATNVWRGSGSTINYNGVCEGVWEKTYEIEPGDTVSILGTDCYSRRLEICSAGGTAIDQSTGQIVAENSTKMLDKSCGTKFIMPDENINLNLFGEDTNGGNYYRIVVTNGSVSLSTITNGFIYIRTMSDFWGGVDSTINFGSTSLPLSSKTYAIPTGTQVTIYGTNKRLLPLHVTNVDTEQRKSYNGTKILSYGSGGCYYNNDSSIKVNGFSFNMPNDAVTMLLLYHGSATDYEVQIGHGSLAIIRPGYSLLDINEVNGIWGDIYSTINYKDNCNKTDTLKNRE